MTDVAGIFEPLPRGRPNGFGSHQDAEEWVPISPVPEDAPQELPRHALGKPSAVRDYRDESGLLLFRVCRWGHKSGKTIRPLTFCEGPGGQRAWRWVAPREPRSLYRLDRLAQRPAAPVLVTEGEKTAHAAAALFPDQVSITSPGGSNAAGKADWSPLAGRRVVVWPDNDEPGRKYAADVVRLAAAAGASSVRVVQVPTDWPEGWDIADPLPGGVTEDRLREMLACAQSGAPVEQQSKGAKPQVNLILASTIKPEPVSWLWNGHLARGKLHILGGKPAAGKTTLALAMAGVVTNGSRWPDGTPCARGRVVIWSGEDDPADTLVPRLIAAGADLDRVHFVASTIEDGEPMPFDPARHLAALAESLSRIDDVALLIVDPVVSAVAGDSHKNAEVRRALQPLADLASASNCVVLGITHFTKGTGGRDPVERLTGSLAFGAVARVVLVAAKSEEDAEEGDERSKPSRLMTRAKSSIGPDGGGFAYDIVQRELPEHPGITTSAVQWGEAIQGTARELLAEAEATDGEAGSSVSEAMDWLRELLASGPIKATAIKTRAKAAGYSLATIRRAQARLGIKPQKQGMDGGWWWELPRRCSRNPEDAPPKMESTFGNFEHLRAGDDDSEMIEGAL